LTNEKHGTGKNVGLFQGDCGGGGITRIQTGRLLAKVIATPGAFNKTFECWETDSGKPIDELNYDELKVDDLSTYPDVKAHTARHYLATRISFIGLAATVVTIVAGGLFFTVQSFIH